MKSHDLRILSRQENVASFYNEASLVLNLSDKERFVETFGLTALEAMTNGLPVIVPTVGGIAEMVKDGDNGYKIDVHDIDKIEKCIKSVLSDKELYLNISHNALEYSLQFSADEINENIIQIIEK